MNAIDVYDVNVAGLVQDLRGAMSSTVTEAQLKAQLSETRFFVRALIPNDTPRPDAMERNVGVGGNSAP